MLFAYRRPCPSHTLIEAITAPESAATPSDTAELPGTLICSWDQLL